jgi:hypothetical protein
LLASDIFNREFAKIGADWTKRPITLTLAGIQTQAVMPNQLERAPAEAKLALLKDAQFLISLREELQAEEARLAASRLALARNYMESVPVPEVREDT